MRLSFEEGERELLIARLGLADDADDATVAAAMGTWMQENPNANNNSENSNDEDNSVDDLEASGDFVVVDTASFARMRRRELVAAEVEEATRLRDRNDLIEEAIADGKISPGRRDHYRGRYDSDSESTTRLLARLQPNTVPLEERGAIEPTDQVDETSYPSEWVPEIAARQTNTKSGRPSRVHGEG